MYQLSQRITRADEHVQQRRQELESLQKEIIDEQEQLKQLRVQMVEMESQRLQLAKQKVVPIPDDDGHGGAQVVAPGGAVSVQQLGSILRQYGVQDALLEKIVQA
eukprot:5609094-Pyramimonas_sp.AAC.1